MRDIAPDEQPPSDADHVLIVPTPKGRFQANGSVGGKSSATFWTPGTFDTVEEAIREAQGWARMNDVPVIDVREKRAP
jgi:hypothetical protein